MGRGFKGGEGKINAVESCLVRNKRGQKAKNGTSPKLEQIRKTRWKGRKYGVKAGECVCIYNNAGLEEIKTKI